jgi:hypothetical protein
MKKSMRVLLAFVAVSAVLFIAIFIMIMSAI